jgi:hypothetical protein
MTMRSKFFALLWLALASCQEVDANGANQFTCTSSSQCTANGAGGRCETIGYCSYPDAACASGYRYGPESLAESNTCVPPPSEDDLSGGDLGASRD